MSSGCVVVFGRQPVPGRVKTRLAERIGNRTAARVYQELLRHTLEAALACDRRVMLSLAEPASATWSPEPQVETELQAKGDLGVRMADAFRRRFSEGEERVVIVGSDCPTVTPDRLIGAFSALDAASPVLAPATDGGYWLAAQRPPGVDFFSGIPWSSPRTLQATRERLRDLGVSWHELVELRDIDTAADLEAAIADPATPPLLAERLRSCLRE